MLRIPKSVLAVGGVVLAGGLIAFTNPKTVHAVAAALVEVTNTASNPVVTQGVGQQAAQLIHLTCSPNAGYACGVLSADGSPGPLYVVPAGQSLVITAVDIVPNQVFVSYTCNVNHEDGLATTSSAGVSFSQLWIVNSVTMHFSYPSGIVFSPGSSIKSFSDFYGTIPQPCYPITLSGDQVDLYGYLTAS